MPTVILQPGAVTLGTVDPATMTPHTQSTVVGSPPQWADSSDASYATVNRRAHSSEPWTGSDFAVAPLDVLTQGGKITAVVATIRCSSSGTGSDRRVDASLYPVGDRNSSTIAYIGDHYITPGGAIQTVVAPFEDNNPNPLFSDLANAALLVRAGAALEVMVASPFGADLTIYEASVAVTFTVSGLPHLRRFPRTDRRVYPVKSQQASPRRGPGSYY